MLRGVEILEEVDAGQLTLPIEQCRRVRTHIQVVCVCARVCVCAHMCVRAFVRARVRAVKDHVGHGPCPRVIARLLHHLDTHRWA